MQTRISESTAHTYPTRKHNVPIKPAASKPPFTNASNTTPHTSNSNAYPSFPPDGVVLHPDDANSKVFLAIARSFLSVDNRAMTIKDLAEMSVHFGLVCQNVSAASQAITSYIRSHMHRCQVEQDCPLLLKHVLSGTPSDDDLLPALYSRSGGAHCPPLENRLTNFRRGTTVWYLGRATGAPCPFARAGIRLCDYTESGKVDSSNNHDDKRREKHHRWEHPPVCGQKRKRPLRGCVAKNSTSASDSESPAEQPPPKVKLTLRLNLAKIHSARPPSRSQSSRPTDVSSPEDDDEPMSVESSEDDNNPQPKDEEPWSLPPYPRRSISIPCYTPCSEGPYPSYFPSPSANTFKDPFRRSPSVARSVGSLPPDSDDDDFHLSMTRQQRDMDEFGWDADLESDDEDEDEDEDETFESPGPRSPSASFVPVVPEVTVKQEPKDVQGIIDEWDDLDSSVAKAKVVVEALARAAAQVLHTEGLGKIKTESNDQWEWDPSAGLSYASELGSPFDEISVKEEDLSLDDLFTTPDFPGSLSSHPLESSSLVDIPCSDSSAYGPNDNSLNMVSSSATVRPRARTVPASSVFNMFSDPSPSRPSSRPSISTNYSDSSSLPPPLSATTTLVSLIQSLSVHSPVTASASSSFTVPDITTTSPTPPQETRCLSSPQAVVVYTCRPCNPGICATYVEDIPVYQMTLGERLVLRRIDTDFVNLSPILAFSDTPQPALNTISNATVITKGSTVVSGTWVPLDVAQAYVRDHPLPGGVLDVFLSDTLFERFPTALQAYHCSSSQERALNQFGRHFASTLRATQIVNGAERNSFALSVPFALSAALGVERHNHEDEPPLSAQEQELFHELCVIPDWDKEVPACADDIPMEVDEGTKIATENMLQVSSSEERMPTPTETPPTSPLSPLSSIDGSASEPPSPVTCTVPVPLLNDAPTPERGARPLRRSKRVAAVAQSQGRTGARRGACRNSVS